MIWGLDGSVRPVNEALPPCVKCDNCGAWGTGGACQICGSVLPPPGPPKVRARDLFEQRATEPDAAKQATLARYVREALSRGHNPWSARHKYRGTYGIDAPEAWFREALREAAAAPKQQSLPGH